jgi:hypothetical protein
MFNLMTQEGTMRALPILPIAALRMSVLLFGSARPSVAAHGGHRYRTCIKSADYDAFRDETMAQYQKAPQFVKDCRLSETRALRRSR